MTSLPGGPEMDPTVTSHWPAPQVSEMGDSYFAPNVGPLVDAAETSSPTVISRRQLMAGGLATAVVALVHQFPGSLPTANALSAQPGAIEGGPEVAKPSLSLTELAQPHGLDAEPAVQEILANEASGELGNDPEHHAKKTHLINLIGTLNFANGVRHMMDPEIGHITTEDYAGLTAALAWKHQVSDEAGKKHLTAELKSIPKSYALIQTGVLASQFLKLDLANVLRQRSEGEPDISDTIALTTMVASVVSPLATTVTSAGMLSPQIRGIAETLGAEAGRISEEDTERNVDAFVANVDPEKRDDVKKQVYQVMQAHASNESGFILVGDPPFIAMVEKFGWVGAMSYQLKVCAPLAVRSLYAANVKLQALRLTGDTAATMEARKAAIEGVSHNLGTMGSIMYQSFLNVFRASGQKDTGIEHQVLAMVQSNLAGLSRLIRNAPMEPHAAHVGDGLTHSSPDSHDELLAEHMLVRTQNILHGGLAPEADELDIEEHTRLAMLINEIDTTIAPESITALATEYERLGLDPDKAAKLAQDTFASKRNFVRKQFEERLAEATNADEVRKLLPRARSYAASLVDLDRLQNAFGHATTDVLNVFPFQAAAYRF